MRDRTMTSLNALTARQERFCERFAESFNATLAARSAGYSTRTARVIGARLLRNPKIAARIAELHADTARAHCRMVETLLAKLEAVYRAAINNHNFHAAARVVELQARLAGIAVPRTPSTGRTRASADGKSAPPLPANDNSPGGDDEPATD